MKVLTTSLIANIHDIVQVLSTKLDEFVQERFFWCPSPESRELWMLVLKAALRKLWQSAFEVLVMPPAEVYQIHRFVTKTNEKGRSQVRCFAISTEKIYNLQTPEGYPPSFGKVKVRNLLRFHFVENLLFYSGPTKLRCLERCYSWKETLVSLFWLLRKEK